MCSLLFHWKCMCISYNIRSAEKFISKCISGTMYIEYCTLHMVSIGNLYISISVRCTALELWMWFWPRMQTMSNVHSAPIRRGLTTRISQPSLWLLQLLLFIASELLEQLCFYLNWDETIRIFFSFCVEFNTVHWKSKPLLLSNHFSYEIWFVSVGKWWT